MMIVKLEWNEHYVLYSNMGYRVVKGDMVYMGNMGDMGDEGDIDDRDMGLTGLTRRDARASRNINLNWVQFSLNTLTQIFPQKCREQ